MHRRKQSNTTTGAPPNAHADQGGHAPRGRAAPCIRAHTRHTWRGGVPSGGKRTRGARPPNDHQPHPTRHRPPPRPGGRAAPSGRGRPRRARRNQPPAQRGCPRHKRGGADQGPPGGIPADRHILIKRAGRTRPRDAQTLHRAHTPRQARGLTPARTTAGWQTRRASDQPARPERPRAPPPAHTRAGWARRGRYRTSPVNPLLRPLLRGATPRPGRNEPTGQGNDTGHKGRGGTGARDNPTTTTGRRARDFASAPQGGADSVPPAGGTPLTTASAPRAARGCERQQKPAKRAALGEPPFT